MTHYFYGITILKIFLNMPLNTFYCNIMFLLKEHTFSVTLLSSIVRNLFFFNFILQFMYCWFRRKWSTGKPTAKSFVTLFLGFLPWIGFRYKNCPCETHFPVHEKSAVYICTGVKWIVWLRHLMVHCTWMDCAKNCQRWVMQCLLHLMTLQGPLPYACTWGIQ